MDYTVSTNFIAGKKGRLYALHYCGNPGRHTGECFVVAPAFAEEMNRCRYMCTMLAQSIAARGYGFLSVDPYGTGDSEGDFSDVTWETLKSDLATACLHAGELGYNRVSILAVRLGALPTMEIAPDIPDLHRIIFWQPEINGQTALTQLLRLKIAGSLELQEKKGTTKEFEEWAERGQHIEVAGYSLSPGLVMGMKKSRMETGMVPSGTTIGWFNTLASADRKAPRSHTTLIEKWSASGTGVTSFSVIGPPYWQVHERTLAPNLIAETSAYVTGQPLA